MILHFRLSICSWGKITVIWTMLGGRASMEHYLRHNKISFFSCNFNYRCSNQLSSSEVPSRIANSWTVG